MKLVSMIERVDSLDNFKDDTIFRHLIYKYKEFLKQGSELGMFVPCLDGKILEEPINTNYSYEERNTPIKDGQSKYGLDYLSWKEAKERVLFEGFTHEFGERVIHHRKSIYIKGKSVENLIKRYGNVIGLTSSAQKQIL